ncbi:DNA-directed RNA polymerase V subunit 7, partial [Clarias magur]
YRTVNCAHNRFVKCGPVENQHSRYRSILQYWGLKFRFVLCDITTRRDILDVLVQRKYT